MRPLTSLFLILLLAGCALFEQPPPTVDLALLPVDSAVVCTLSREGDLVTVTVEVEEARSDLTAVFTTYGDLLWPTNVSDLRETEGGAVGLISDRISPQDTPFDITVYSPERLTVFLAQYDLRGVLQRTDCT